MGSRAVHAQDAAPASAPLTVPAPFSSIDLAKEAATGVDVVWELELAESALRGGFHSLAEPMFQKLVEPTAGDPALHRRVLMGRVDALIGEGRGADAMQALDQVPEPHDDPWRLRRGLAHFLQSLDTRTPEAERREIEAVAEQIRDMQADAMGRDVTWLFFLRAVLAAEAGDGGEADRLFGRAIGAATSEPQRAVLWLARFQQGLSATDVTESAAAQLAANRERQANKPLGFQFTLPYAVVLQRLGQPARAIAELKRQRETVPATEPVLRDQTLLLLGLIAGADSEDGRLAFRELLERGRDIEYQRIALMRLAAAARMDATRASTELKRLLTALLERVPPHPLTEDLLFFRAELALRAGAWEDAEADARAVLTRFPGSNRLRREALGILASSSWQRQPRYRTAADYLAQIQALPNISPADNARLALMKGECYFRAGRQDNTVEDYRNAAAAYAEIRAGGVLPEGATAGLVFFQRVIAHIRADALDTAMLLLDDPTQRDGVDVESWWQAEWNLARELQLQGRGAEAIARIDRMTPESGIPAELQLRFLWLAAQVSLEAGRREETETRVARVREFVEGPRGAEISPERRADVASNAALLEAEARLRAGDREAGRVALERLRTTFAGSLAADYSYIVEAGFLAGENRLVEAMQLLSGFADSRQDSRYAPEALYQAALLSIQRGQREHLEEATRLLDQIVTRHGHDNHVFQARLKQAEVKTNLNAFSDAEAIYRALESDFPNHKDFPLVQISLAGVLMAQASVEPAKIDGAVSRFERVMANESLPVDLRAEAGARLAAGWQAQGNTARAAEICWEVYHRFVEDSGAVAQLGSTGRFWIARAVLLLGEIEERENHYDNARRLYQSLLDHGLPGDKVASARIAKLLAPAGGGG